MLRYIPETAFYATWPIFVFYPLSSEIKFYFISQTRMCKDVNVGNCTKKILFWKNHQALFKPFPLILLKKRIMQLDYRWPKFLLRSPCYRWQHFFVPLHNTVCVFLITNHRRDRKQTKESKKNMRDIKVNSRKPVWINLVIRKEIEGYVRWNRSLIGEFEVSSV